MEGKEEVRTEEEEHTINNIQQPAQTNPLLPLLLTLLIRLLQRLRQRHHIEFVSTVASRRGFGVIGSRVIADQASGVDVFEEYDAACREIGEEHAELFFGEGWFKERDDMDVEAEDAS